MNNKTKRIVLVTGGFDPIHSGHLDYLNSAKLLGDELWVGVNSDQWLINKKGSFFMPFDERCSIISNLKCVNNVIPVANDHLNSSAIDAIEHCLVARLGFVSKYLVFSFTIKLSKFIKLLLI